MLAENERSLALKRKRKEVEERRKREEEERCKEAWEEYEKELVVRYVFINIIATFFHKRETYSLPHVRQSSRGREGG